MAAETFWNNREQAQKADRRGQCASQENRSAAQGGKATGRFQGDGGIGRSRTGEPHNKIAKELERDLAKFFKELDALELKVFLNGPHDKNNCIFSINAGAGGTESCDWANMLLRMYQRWAESRGWEVEVTDALPGETAGIKSATLLIKGENAYGFCKAERGRASVGAHFAV